MTFGQLIEYNMRNIFHVKQKSSCYDKSIYLLQRFECSCTHFQTDEFFLEIHEKVQVYHYKNILTKINKIQIIIMELSNHIMLCQISMDRN